MKRSGESKSEVEYDPMSVEVREDPTEAYRQLREKCPVHFYEPLGFYSISRHEDVTAVLRCPELWSNRGGPGPSREKQSGPAMLLNTDPPEHTEQRRLVSKAFTPAMIRLLAPRILDEVTTLIDAFLERGSGDLIEDLAYPLPVFIIAELLGVPREHRATFKRWSDAVVAQIGMAPGALEAGRKARGEFAAFFTEQLAWRAAAVARGESIPEDILSVLATSTLQDRRLEVDESLSILVQLLVAGHETTTNLIGNVVFRLLEDRSRWQRVVSEPALVEVAIEESLRLDSPVRGLFRTNLAETELHGTRIPRDSKVMMLFGAANRDRAEWNHPDSFRLDRDLAHLRRHYAFGFGTHYCLGAPLARLEAQTALRELITRVPELRLDGDPEWLVPFFVRGLRHLPVAWQRS